MYACIIWSEMVVVRICTYIDTCMYVHTYIRVISVRHYAHIMSMHRYTLHTRCENNVSFTNLCSITDQLPDQKSVVQVEETEMLNHPSTL
jgi:hypothetical protein